MTRRVAGDRLESGQGSLVESGTESQLGVWVFYVVFIVLLFGESFIVRLVLATSRHFGHPSVGPWAAWCLFVAGGAGLGFVELKSIRPAQRMRDPILRACCWLQRRLGVIGFVVNAALLGGAPGSAVALVSTRHPRRLFLTCLAAILFATTWVPLFVFLWR